MKTHPIIFLSATRLLAAALMFCFALPLQASAVLSLKGTTTETRNPGDGEIRLSVLSYVDEQGSRDFLAKFQEYQANNNHENFLTFLREQQTRGYIFSKEATGYTIKYAWQNPAAPDQHMVFVVTPALKTLNPYMWKSRNDSVAPFTVLEIKYEGDKAIMKSSLNSSVGANTDGSSLVLTEFDQAEPFAILLDNTPYYLKQPR